MGAKSPVNLTLDRELVERARALGISLSQALEASLYEIVRQAEIAAWREENREAIERSNAELAENGLWSDGLRLL